MVKKNIIDLKPGPACPLWSTVVLTQGSGGLIGAKADGPAVGTANVPCQGEGCLFYLTEFQTCAIVLIGQYVARSASQIEGQTRGVGDSGK